MQPALSIADSIAAVFGATKVHSELDVEACYKAKSFGLLPPSTRRLLDVGSGTGDDALALAERLGPDATVIGIDLRLEAVDEALRKARNVALNVRFAVGDGYLLPFDDATFDAVRADFLFGFLDQPARAARELARVLCRRGVLLLTDREDVLIGEHGAVRAFERAGIERLEVADRFGRATTPGLTVWGSKS
jgi:ubiquinone/menaquinone biosynthesis C-methylase UbiE